MENAVSGSELQTGSVTHNKPKRKVCAGGWLSSSHATTPALNVLWLTVGLGALELPFVVFWAVANDLGKQFCRTPLADG